MAVPNVTAGNSPVSGDYTGPAKKGKKNDEVSMQDFFTLLAAQMQNQNMMDPVKDTEFLSQMAQFSALTATQQLNTNFMNFMAVSYIGKNVKAELKDESGKPQPVEGIAQKVEFIDGGTFITVNGKTVSPEAITEVKA
jgi:flagellar basal-body rod modification protein FlgD